ncbi:hypothetical protein TTHERM_00189120 (macronuclear) [Tetrahymena thermophila SB210]|uniref:Leucine Rich Repeat family protein n=1 Tax=Tetrahymena thermophila (strain SB210) TaxID=312017 RepID=I7MEH1_TETTS|nr:hypothetical protein TTHERM_00189120 [Tetrahymena thermophila SB210]EAR96343.2 hypothetical protein TTHERM_00189120 [Tetrahymena thermophila SB210]|eukprot:XP_001016588.2 hypothetical protein TTHERM_00189120 [Tetrahymena thermophila SB210]
MASSNVSQYNTVKTQTGFRLQSAQNYKKEFSRLNDSFNELKDKIQDAQGTKFTFYRLNKQKNEQKQQRCNIQMSRECGTVSKRNQSANYYDPSSISKTGEDIQVSRNEIFIKDLSESGQRSKRITSLNRGGMQSSIAGNKSGDCQYCCGQVIQSKSGLPIKSFNTFLNAKKQINDNNSAVFTQKGCTCNNNDKQRSIISPYNPQLDDSINMGYNSQNISMNLMNNGNFTNSSLNNMKVKVSSKAVVNSLLSISAKARSLSMNNNYANNAGSNQRVQKTNPTTTGWNIHIDNHDKTLLSALDPDEIEKIKNSAELIHTLSIDTILDLYTAKCQDNQIEYIPEQAMNFIIKFKKTSKKRQLKLQDLSLGSKSAYLISEILKESDHFCRLYLDKNQVGNQGAYFLSEMLQVNSSLIHLDVSGNNIGPEGFEVLFRSLIYNCTLISLDVASKDGLNRNRIGQIGADQLEKLLRFNSSIQFLNLCGTSINNDQLKLIMKGLNDGKSLTMIDISQNDLDSNAAEIIVSNIQNSNITELYMSSNQIGDVGLSYFQDVGLHSKLYPLETLDLSQNKITTRGLAGFFQSMHKNQNLHKLILNDNNFQGIQMNKIAEFLHENTGIQHLSFERCEIQPEGVSSIAYGLEKNKNLTYLNLKENKVRNQGAKSLAEALSHKSHLQVLDLSLCKIEDEGGMALAAALTKSSLYSLNLRENSLHDCVGALICSSLEKNTYIRKINVERNPINYSYQEKIKKSLQYNQSLFESKKIPMFTDILNNMKGKQKENEDLDEQQVMKGQQYDFLQSQVDNLKQKLQKLLHEEEAKMIQVEAIKKEVQAEFDQYEKAILNQKKEQNQWHQQYQENVEDVERKIKQQNSDKTKILQEIAARKQYIEKKKEELLTQKLNQQSKLREAETQTKQIAVITSQIQAKIDDKKQQILQKQQEIQALEQLEQLEQEQPKEKRSQQGLREISTKKNKK